MSKIVKDAFKEKTPTEKAILLAQMLEVAMIERNKFEEEIQTLKKTGKEIAISESNFKNQLMDERENVERLKEALKVLLESNGFYGDYNNHDDQEDKWGEIIHRISDDDCGKRARQAHKQATEILGEEMIKEVKNGN